MKQRRPLALRLKLCIALLLLASCSIDAPQPPAPINRETALALTPSPTTTAVPTLTPAPTATATAAPTPTVEPTEAPAASATPQALADVNYCRRAFGPTNAARFSARLQRIQTAQTSDFEQITFVFADLDGQLHGDAACMLAASWPLDADYGSGEVPGDAIIALQLDSWAHDELFAASPLTETTEITAGGLLERVSFAARTLDSRGAVLGIGLSEPRPFRVRVQSNELLVEVERDAAFPPQDDPLGQAAGAEPALTEPVYFLQNGDVYRLQNSQARPVAQTPELETGLAVSPDGTLLAVCRAPADAEPFALPYEVRATLWVMRVDGSEPQQLADVGGCAEPAFATSGKTIAFAANVAPSPPAILQIWTVPTVGGEPTPAAGPDEWSRSQPHWLADGRLVYRARNDAGQSIVLVRSLDGKEQEVTARILTDEAYKGVGDFVVDQVNGQIALEALRSADDGADMVVLRVDGTPVAVEQRGYWQRPLAFTDQGLVYLTAECPSESVMPYTIRRRPNQGSVETLVSGSTAAGLGSATAQGNTLVYVRANSEAGGVRGPMAEPGQAEASSIWTMTLDGTARANVYTTNTGVTGLQLRKR